MVTAATTDQFDTMSREEIKAFLTEVAERHIAAASTYNQIKSDPSRELTIWQTAESGIALTVCTMKASGLEVADFIAFNNPEVFPQSCSTLDPILTCRKLDDYTGEGYFIMYQHIKTPIMVSNRCVFSCVYDMVMLENGGYT